MKNRNLLILASAIVGMMEMGAASATTSISDSLFSLGNHRVINLGTGVKPRSWYDNRKENPPGTPNPAYKLRWTHTSKWGYFHAVSGHVYNITVVSSNPDIHPGMSLYYRTNLFDKAGKSKGLVYVKDHLLKDTDLDIGEKLPVDETDNDKVTPYSMILESWGYDQDGASTPSALLLHPIQDGVEGTLSLTFTAANTGTYMVVIGGIYPNATLADDTAFYPATAQVQEVVITPK